MPSFLSSGMATSARHVVGLQEPPRKTSGASTTDSSLVDPSVFVCWSSAICFFILSELFGESEVIWNGWWPFWLVLELQLTLIIRYRHQAGEMSHNRHLPKFTKIWCQNWEFTERKSIAVSDVWWIQFGIAKHVINYKKRENISLVVQKWAQIKNKQSGGVISKAKRMNSEILIGERFSRRKSNKFLTENPPEDNFEKHFGLFMSNNCKSSSQTEASDFLFQWDFQREENETYLNVAQTKKDCFSTRNKFRNEISLMPKNHDTW